MQHGFSALILLVFIPLAAAAYFLLATGFSPVKQVTSPVETYDWAKKELAEVKTKTTSNVSWQYNDQTKTWEAIGVAPDCPDPLTFPSPVDVNLATSVLYPGQLRGGDYKPHGGFRFDNQPNNEIDVYAPMDGKLYQAARHLEAGEIQYALYFINDCGIMYKLDHLRTLTSKFEQVLDTIPMGAEGDSRTTYINPPTPVSQGELIATKVGFEKSTIGVGGRNIFIDFGVYDLRTPNGVEYSAEFLAAQPNINSFGSHAICWLDNLEEPARTIVKSLPGSDVTSGKQSDYCQ